MKTIADTAKAWGVPNSTVRLWMRKGLVQSVRLGANATMIVTDEKPVTPPRGRPKKAQQ